jgi:ubiquinone/menaquinone biosynthesis C-methylase UbiE
MRVLPIDSLLIFCLAAIWLIWQPTPESGIALVASTSALIYRIRKNKKEAVYDHTYSALNSSEFYSAIAGEYDARNSQSLQKAHLTALEKIQGIVANRSSWSVIDFGGGTGKLIALHFFNNESGTWIVVDSSANMAAEFSKNLNASKLKKEVAIERIESYLDNNDIRQHDVVLISYLLSSLQKNPNWNELAKRIKPDGKLIVVDAEPSYSEIHPHFAVEVDKKVYALKTRPVSGTTLVEELALAGLVMESGSTIKNGENPYAYIYVFKADNTKELL